MDYLAVEESKGIKEIRRQTIRERLVERRTRLNRDLIEIEGVLEVLNKNPGFEEVHNAIMKVGII